MCDCVNMSDVQMLKSSVNHRLTVAAEEEMILLKEEKDRQEKLLDSVFNPELHRAGLFTNNLQHNFDKHTTLLFDLLHAHRDLG